MWRTSVNKTAVRLLVLCGVLLLSGCDSERLKEFSSLAAAGSAYAAVSPSFAAQLGSAQITINNDQAVIAHANPIDPATAKHNIRQQDADLKAYLSTLDRLNAQAALLGAYFDAMAQLANSKNTDQIVTSANGLIAQINKVNDSVAQSKLSNSPTAKSIEDLVGQAAGLVVTHFQVKALDNNLEANAKTIDRALALQEAAIRAMQLQFSLALAGDDAFREETQVISPYVSTKDLPKSWASDRTAYIQSSVSMASADAAEAAITKLRVAFQEVVQNKGSQVDFNGILDAIGKMAGYANDVKTAISSSR